MENFTFGLVKISSIKISGGGTDLLYRLDSFHYEIWKFLPDLSLHVHCKILHIDCFSRLDSGL